MKEILKAINEEEELGLVFTIFVFIGLILVIYDWYIRLEGVLK